MLTVKYVDGDGIEWMTECKHVVADKTIDGAPRILVFDDIPDAHRSNSSGVYVDDGARSAHGPIAGPMVYVMNRFGSTVAKYQLQRPQSQQVYEPDFGRAAAAQVLR